MIFVQPNRSINFVYVMFRKNPSYKDGFFYVAVFYAVHFQYFPVLRVQLNNLNFAETNQATNQSSIKDSVWKKTCF